MTAPIVPMQSEPFMDNMLLAQAQQDLEKLAYSSSLTEASLGTALVNLHASLFQELNRPLIAQTLRENGLMIYQSVQSEFKKEVSDFEKQKNEFRKRLGGTLFTNDDSFMPEFNPDSLDT